MITFQSFEEKTRKRTLKKHQNLTSSPYLTSSGKPIAVHTPPKRVTTCEILPTGKYITVALENQSNLVTLELKNRNNNATNQSEDADSVDVSNVYGEEENNCKTFQL